MPIISVITPAYNASDTIQETINSVLAQTFCDFELIIVDDGSTDETLTVVQGNSDSRIRVFSFENAGPQKSRNRGIEKAKGQYITFIDADDLWTEDKLEQQLEALQQQSTAAVAYSWTDFIDEKSQVTRSGKYSTEEGDVFEALLRDDFVSNGSNPLIREEALRSVGGFDEAILAGQDWDMWLTLAAHYPFVVVPKVQILYRKVVSSNSWSSHFGRQEVGLIQVIKKHLTAREHLTTLKSVYFATCYRNLLFECFDKGKPSFQNGIRALRFFTYAIALEPRWWHKRYRLILIMLIKSVAYLFPRTGRLKVHSISNT